MACKSIKPFTYTGCSMYPTLSVPDIIKVIPYEGEEIRRGDVVIFMPPCKEVHVIHRVVSVAPQGIKTRGDNCKKTDPWTLTPDAILGRVTYAYRATSKRQIYRGLFGRLYILPNRIILTADTTISNLFRPLYHWLVKHGTFRSLLPEGMKPRVVPINHQHGTGLQLRMGHRVIGLYLPKNNGWKIRRPFRLFVDETSLPKGPTTDQSTE